MFTRKLAARTALAIGSLALIAGSLTACSGGSGSDSDNGKVTISFLTSSDPATKTIAKRWIAGFEKANPNVTVKSDTAPPDDNYTKTQLSTGEMNDVFIYNSGSLLQALNPDTTLVDLSHESWVKNLNKDFKSAVSTSKGLYGAPDKASYAGGVLYNKKVYAKLGLTVPTTWAEFMSNSQKIKDSGDGVAPIIQAYGDNFTAQLFVLEDFANVLAQDPNWAKKYTANKAKYSSQPALAGFQHQADAYKAGLFNTDFRSLTNEQALKMLAEGTGAQYPMPSQFMSTIVQNYPDKVDDIGVFALPADKASDTQLTVWEPDGLYIPKTTTGAKLDAAKKFIAFATATAAGCKIQNEGGSVAGPYVTSACKTDSDAPAFIADIDKYFKSGKTAPALEFLSPVKGPNLPNITVQVGSGISSAAAGAALYDQDVKKQAQQLGLKGW